jgi:transcriptional regulator with XRE-family HTH domain
MVRRFRPTWTQADYQKDYHRHKLMTKVVDSVLASGLSYIDIAKRAGVAQSTLTRWVTGDTKNGKIDTIMSVLEALNMEMVLVTRKEAQDHMRKERATHVRDKSVAAS